MLASLVFAPEIVLPALRGLTSAQVHASGFNATVTGGWISEGEFGLDQGMTVLMIENYRSGLLWRLLKSSPHIRRGLRRAGFRGGWLGWGRLK